MAEQKRDRQAGTVESAPSQRDPSACLLPGRRLRRRPGLRQKGLGFGLVFGLLCLFFAAGIGGLVWFIEREENSGFLRARLIGTLESGLGEAHTVNLGRANMRLAGLAPTFTVERLGIVNSLAGGEARLERADLALSSAFWRLSPEPTRIAFEGLALVLPVSSGAPMASPAAIAAAFRGFLAALAAPEAGGGLFARLEEVEGRRISIAQRLADGSARPLLDGLMISGRREEGRFRARIARAGQTGSIEIAVNAGPAGVESQRLAMEIGPVRKADLIALFGIEVPGLDPAITLALTGEASHRADGSAGVAQLALTIRDGGFTPPDPEVPPIHIDHFELAIAERSGEPGLEISRIALRTGEADVVLAGRLDPDAERPGGYRLSLAAEKPAIDRPSPQEPVVQLTSARLEGAISPDFRTLALERIRLVDIEGSAEGSALFSLNDGGRIESKIAARGLDLRRALRIWPVSVAPNTRRWVLGHAFAGRLTRLDLASALQGQALIDAFNKRPIPDEGMQLEFELENLTIRPILDAAEVTKGRLVGRVSGRRAEFKLEEGEAEAKAGQVVQLRDAQFRIANTAQKPALMEMIIPHAGSVEGVLAVLAAPSLRNVAALPSQLAITAGRVEALAQVDLRLVAKPEGSDVKVEFRGDLRNVAVDNLIKGENLEAGNFTLNSKAGVTTLKGEARIGGVPNQIDLRAETGKPTVAVLKSVMDDAQRARRGMDFRPVLTGPVGVTVTASLERSAAPDVDVELDLARAKVEGIVPGFLKRPGQPGKVSFDFSSSGERMLLGDFDLGLGSISAVGSLELAREGGLNRAELTSLKLSPGDNTRATIERRAGALKITLRGNAFDLRPFLRGLQSGRVDGGKQGDLDLDIQSTVLVGFNGELLSAADVKAEMRGGQLNRLGVKGRFGANPVTVETIAQGASGPTLQIDSADAGALARFMDIYPRVVGGRLTGEIAVGAGSQRGTLQVRDFVIRGEPALRQYAQAAESALLVEGQAVLPRGATLPNRVPFTKFRAQFQRQPGRLDIAEAVIWGPQVGGSLEGTLDYAGDRVDLKGAFVPAYALNNLFAQVPLLGPLLGGSQYEGLFAVPFLISGKASEPVLRTNPISVIAPGILRKFFEIQREGSAAAPAARPETVR